MIRARIKETASTWASSVGNHLAYALLSRALDHVASITGSTLAIGLASLLLRKGRILLPMAWVVDKVISPAGISSVFSLYHLMLHLLLPVVFPDAESAEAEIYYSFHRESAVTMPIYVFFCLVFRYPSATWEYLKAGLVQAIRHPLSAVRMGCKSLLALILFHLFYAQVVETQLASRMIDASWR